MLLPFMAMACYFLATSHVRGIDQKEEATFHDIISHQTEMTTDLANMKEMLTAIYNKVMKIDCVIPHETAKKELSDTSQDRSSLPKGENTKQGKFGNQTVQPKVAESIYTIIEKAKSIAAMGGTAEVGLVGGNGKQLSRDDPRYKAMVKKLIARGFPSKLIA